MSWLVRGGVVKATSQSSADVIKEFGHCVYTSLRTYKGLPVSLNVHYERLKKSAQGTDMREPSADEIVEIVKSASSAIGPDKDGVLMIATNGQEIVTHVKELPPLPTPPVKAHVVASTRKYGEVKDSTWVTEREALEWPEGVNELLLMSEDGSILEGTSSNFFVIKGNVLQTANDHILSGSIRRLVVRVAQEKGIALDLTPPNWNERGSWEGAFITSTSRLVLPLNVLFDQHDGTVSFDTQSPLVADLAQGVEQELARESGFDLST